LYAGPDGLDDYRALAPLLAAQIAPGGVACLEIGAGQGDAAAALFRAECMGVTIARDLAGHDRCLVVTP
jgi:release factor glutamine methyltransferase